MGCSLRAVLVLAVVFATGSVPATGPQLPPKFSPLSTRFLLDVVSLALASWLAIDVRFRRTRTCTDG